MCASSPARRRSRSSAMAASRAGSPIDATKNAVRGRAPGRLGHREHEPLDAGGEADADAVGPAELLHEAVVAPAAENRVLRADGARQDLERRARVVVEAAHEPVRHAVRDPVDAQVLLDRREVRPARLAQVVDRVRQAVDDRLILRHLAVEDPQRVRRRPAAGSRRTACPTSSPSALTSASPKAGRHAGQPTEFTTSSTSAIPSSVTSAQARSSTSASMAGSDTPNTSTSSWWNWR